MKKFFLFFFFLLISFSFCIDHCYDREIEINGTNFFVKIAYDEFTRYKGYMGTKFIEKGNGMLFMFKTDQNLYFWMKNTSVPLEIAYIDSNGVIKEIYSLEPFSEKSVKSSYKVKYALEFPRGSFSLFKIQIGDTVKFNFDLNSIQIE